MKTYIMTALFLLGVQLTGIANICFATALSGIGDTTFNVGDWLMEWVPDKTPYPSYIADPRRPRMHMGVGGTHTNIPEVSDEMVNLDAGTRVTLLKMQSSMAAAHEFAVDMEGGFFGRFDMINGFDNYGLDGRYGIYTAWDWSDTIAARFGYRHLSCHLGDEYMVTTGRSRFNYTRNDLRLGLAVRFTQSILFYVEPSWAWQMGNPARQRAWAIEGGGQYQGPYNVWKDSMAWYGGVHIASFKENDWSPSVACQVGLELQRDPKQTKLKFGIEGYTGRALLGEFALDYHESYLSAGIYFDYF